MGLGGWLSDRLGIRLDSHTLGNLVKNLAPVAGTVIGGPLGLAAAGAMGGAGELGRGGNLSDALKAGLSNASLAGVGQAAGGALGYHGGLGSMGGNAGGFSGSAASAPTSAATSASPGLVDSGSGIMQPGMPAGLASTSVPRSGLLSTIGDKAGGMLDFAEAHPNAASGALQGLGGIMGSGAKNRLTNAQATQAEQQVGETAYDFQRRQARDAQLAPLWGSLNTNNDPFGYGKVAKSPYAPTGA